MNATTWMGLAITLGVLLLIFGLGAWFARHSRPQQLRTGPQEPPGAPGASERTDIISPLPLVFDRPIRHRYDPEEFAYPLECVTCHMPILPTAEFWEIPILNQEPNAMLAVCLQCDSRSPYDQLEK